MMTFLIVVFFLGLIVAAIASNKGRSAFAWWVYGSLLFIVAFPHALLMEGANKCPHCAETVKAEADVCKHCGRDI